MMSWPNMFRSEKFVDLEMSVYLCVGYVTQKILYKFVPDRYLAYQVMPMPI